MAMTEAEKKRSLKLKKAGKTGAQRVADTQKRRKKAAVPTVKQTGTRLKRLKNRNKKALEYK